MVCLQETQCRVFVWGCSVFDKGQPMKPTKILTAGISKAIASLLAGSALAFASTAHATPYLQTNIATDDTEILAGLGYAVPGKKFYPLTEVSWPVICLTHN